MSIKREKGKTVKPEHRKYIVRYYFILKKTFDLKPVWWKYYALGARNHNQYDRESYAFKWGLIEFHIENVRMNLTQ